MQTADIRRNRNRKRRSQRGMTILEIMIVLAIIALVMGFLVGPKIMKMFGESKVDVTRAMLREYADEAMPMWLKNNPGKSCPSALGDLNEYTNKKTAKDSKDGKADIGDAWGNPMVMQCPPPPGAHTLGVVSAGADGKMDTTDDLHSYD